MKPLKYCYFRNHKANPTNILNPTVKLGHDIKYYYAATNNFSQEKMLGAKSYSFDKGKPQLLGSLSEGWVTHVDASRVQNFRSLTVIYFFWDNTYSQLITKATEVEDYSI